jgi:hypothetical protein
MNKLLNLNDAARVIFLQKNMQIDDDEIREQFIADIEKMIEERLQSLLFDSLDDRAVIELKYLIDNNQNAEDFLARYLENNPELLESAILMVKDEYLN